MINDSVKYGRVSGTEAPNWNGAQLWYNHEEHNDVVELGGEQQMAGFGSQI